MSLIPNLDRENSALLNAIRDGASDAYKERIPEVNAENMARVSDSILNYEFLRNEFTQALFNKIAFNIIKSMTFKNPLSIFKGEKMDFGATIEEVWVKMAKDVGYTLDGEHPFTLTQPQIDSVFHIANRESKYPVSINENQLRKAFQNDRGLSSLTDKIMNSLYAGDEYDEFLLTKNLLLTYAQSGKFTLEEIPALNATNIKNIMKTIQLTAEKMAFPTSKYTYANNKTTCPLENQVLLMTPEFKVEMDLEVLAVAFHMDKAEMKSRIITIDDFGGLNCDCALVSEDWFVINDRFIEMRDIYNPSNLTLNLFLHHHGLLSVSPFENAVLFVYETPDITSITVAPAAISLLPGSNVQFTISNFASVGDLTSAQVVYSITGQTSANTIITPGGLLHLGSDEVGTTSTITVTATSTLDDGVTDTATVTVL